MPYGEVYSAIQRGIIGGAENNYLSYDTSLHYKVAKYYTMEEHVRIPELLIANQNIKDRVSGEDLEIISEFVEAVRPLYDQYAISYLEIIKQIQEMK